MFFDNILALPPQRPSPAFLGGFFLQFLAPAKNHGPHLLVNLVVQVCLIGPNLFIISAPDPSKK
jgi:hypothetical protein